VEEEHVFKLLVGTRMCRNDASAFGPLPQRATRFPEDYVASTNTEPSQALLTDVESLAWTSLASIANMAASFFHQKPYDALRTLVFF